MSSTKFVFFELIGKTRWPPWPLNWLRHFRLLLWNRWTEFNKTWQEARSQRPLPSLCFSRRFKKTRWPPWPLIGWDIFDFSETAERNSTKLDRKQDRNVLYKVCVFRADRKKQDGRPGLWLAETFLTSSLKPLNEIQRNVTGSKILMSCTKFVFFGLIGKTRWPPRPLIGWDMFDFFSETAEQNSTKSWQEARFQRPLPSLCFFGPIGKTRWPPWSLIGWDIFNFFSKTAERNSTKHDRKQDLNVLY